MLRAIIADLHLGQLPGDLPVFADTLREVLARGASEVTFLGDLFKALVGFPRFWDEPVRAGLESLAALRRAGVRVVMVEGNRDFFLDAPELNPFRDCAGLAHSFVSGGRRFLLEHGDTINRRDRLYLLWRSVSKSGAARVWARLLPRRLANLIVHRTEAQLARTNFTHRKKLPQGCLEAAAHRHFESGVDVVLWGHFHRPWQLAVGSHEALVLPAWLDTGSIAWVDPRGEVRIESRGHFVDSASGSWYQGHENDAVAR